MTDEINPLDAKRLREAFKNTDDDEEWDGKVFTGDYVQIMSWSGAGKRGRALTIFKGGKKLAEIEVTNSTLKRLKREWLYWNDIQAGTTSDYRISHGKLGKGW